MNGLIKKTLSLSLSHSCSSINCFTFASFLLLLAAIGVEETTTLEVAFDRKANEGLILTSLDSSRDQNKLKNKTSGI